MTIRGAVVLLKWLCRACGDERYSIRLVFGPRRQRGSGEPNSASPLATARSNSITLRGTTMHRV
jgi:hypothetical protein